MKLRDPDKAGKYFKLNGDLALKNFNQWIEMKRNELVQFDHAFGLTTYRYFKYYFYNFFVVVVNYCVLILN